MHQAWRDRPVSALLPWWWALWVVYGLIWWVILISGTFDPEVVPSSTTLALDIFMSALLICDGVLVIFIVLGITSRQDDKYRRMMIG